MLSLVPVYAPGLAQPLQSLLLSLIQLDLLMTDQWLPQLCYNEEELVEWDAPLSECFEIGGYQSKQTIINAGSVLVYAIVMANAFIVLGVLKGLRKRSRVLQRMHEKLDGQMKWNTVIRFIMQQYSALILAASINMYQEFNSTDPNGFISSSIISWISLASLVPIFVVFARILRQNPISDRCSTLTEGLNTSNWVGKHWKIAFLVRQFSMISILVFLRDHPSLQLVSLHTSQLFLQSLILLYNPLQNNLENRMCLFNECMVSLYLYFLQVLCLLNDEDTSGVALGWCLLCTLLLSIFVNLAKTFYLIVIELMRKRAGRVKIYHQTMDSKAKQDVTRDCSQGEIQVPQASMSEIDAQQAPKQGIIRPNIKERGELQARDEGSKENQLVMLQQRLQISRNNQKQLLQKEIARLV
ncbi:hypothetical protein FGO68_gene13310 [Halteria grandinella]|uniref:Uncharacterized protein n=1 Tax=Halteria grandinella TaxID=5974 RepID=A0A8J8P768_HALGN|nr:hypothetical protein FGO68_gene13310 [Halteria grandinella]